jgi:cytidylate kinase
VSPGAVVAIDGSAGAGKSTLARGLAQALGLPYLNTGLMYRALARAALRRGLDPGDADALTAAARDLAFEMETAGDPPALLIGGAPPGQDLQTAEVEAIVSRVASHPPVREVLRQEQRRLGRRGAVVEGRDIGGVVFPDAALKVFVHADPAVRAARRQAERGTEDPDLAEALARRDALDARTNPLVAAPDARVIDTTGREPEEVLRAAVALARAALGEEVR